MLTRTCKWWCIAGGLAAAGLIGLLIASSASAQELPKVAAVPASSQSNVNLEKSIPLKQIAPQKLLSILGCGDVDGLKALLDAGIDPNFVVSPSGRTLLMAAQNAPMVRLLLERGADPRMIDNRGATALHHAVVGPEGLEIIPLLLDKGADINAADDMGYTVLISAVVNDKPDLVRLMLDSGADPGIRTREGQSALDWAQELGIVDIVDLLESAFARRQ